MNPKRKQDRFSWTKLFFVCLNLFGVALVSELTGTGYGLLFSLISAVSYAGFLQTFSVMTGMKGKVDRSLMFGEFIFLLSSNLKLLLKVKTYVEVFSLRTI